MNIYPHKLFFLNPFYRDGQTPAGLDDWLTLVQGSITNPQQSTLNYERDLIRKASKLIVADNVTSGGAAQYAGGDGLRDASATM